MASDPQQISIDKQIEQSRIIKNLTANNNQLRSALKKCLNVLSGEDLNKDCLIRALEAGRDALQNQKTQKKKS
jgi:hypothetical protein